MLKPIKDWDDAFANSAHVPGSEKLPDLWARQAAVYRASGVQVEQNIAYGERPREVMDMIWPEATPKGLVVFIHGGYWMRFDKSYWTDLAMGARAQGWAVCLPSYTLAPEARIRQITQQMGAAIALAANRVAGPLRICGHSAGGHLASRMICADSPLPSPVLARVAHAMSISGLHDLRPLLHTKLNDTLHLDEAEACSESAALHRPGGLCKLTCWVGGRERPEFIRQSRLMAEMWSGLDVETACVIEGQHDHFTIIEGLKDPHSAITTALLTEG